MSAGCWHSSRAGGVGRVTQRSRGIERWRRTLLRLHRYGALAMVGAQRTAGQDREGRWEREVPTPPWSAKYTKTSSLGPEVSRVRSRSRSPVSTLRKFAGRHLALPVVDVILDRGVHVGGSSARGVVRPVVELTAELVPHGVCHIIIHHDDDVCGGHHHWSGWCTRAPRRPGADGAKPPRSATRTAYLSAATGARKSLGKPGLGAFQDFMAAFFCVSKFQ